MKITAFILLVGCLQVSATGYTQKVTLSYKNAPLETIFNALEKQTNYVFFLEFGVLQRAKKVSIDVKDIQFSDALTECLKDQELTYSLVKNTVIIEPKKKAVVVANNEMAPSSLIDIRGRIVNDRGEPVVATITVKGTKVGVTSNERGEFILQGVDGSAVLVISGVGIEATEIRVDGRTFLSIAAKIIMKPLDEVQMIAYGATTKRFNTGNVTSVKATDLERQPVSNPLLALQGRVPGLVITQGSGVPGAGVTVRVQGRNSILGGTDPLYIIDGIPYPSQMLSTTTGGARNGIIGILGTSGTSNLTPGGNGNPLSFIGVDNIESIEVLKDADATSIYGSRGANGVIMITTKKSGSKGKNKVELNFRQGWGKVSRTFEMMNTEQYLEMRNEALANDGLIPSANPSDNGTASTGFRIYAPDIKLWDSTRYTNWQKVLIGGTSHYTDANGSISGGNGNTNYRIGGGFQRQTTVFPGNFDNKRKTINVNINNQSQDRKFALQFSASYVKDDNNLPQADFTTSALSLPPNAPSIYNLDGGLNWALNSIGNSSWTNPLAQLYNEYENTTENLISSFVVGYKIIPDLELKTQLGYNLLQTNEFSGSSILSTKPESRTTFVRSAQYTSSDIKFYLVEPQLHYTRTFGKAKIDVLLGTTVQQNQNKGEVINASGHPTDDLERDIRSATSFIIPSSIDAIYKYNALFSRINMNWNNKYILNLTGRRDGSSRFGPENRFHNFASIGGAWLFTEEGFLKKQSILSFGKFRASYGTTGNDQIGDYTYLDLYNSVSNAVPYQNWSSIAVNKIPNPYLQWEETRKLSLGFNMGFINDRILADVTFNRNRSSNQLVAYSLPYTAGFTTIMVNLPATIQNISWEFALNSMNIKQKNFSWESSFNLTIPKNKLISFPGIEKTGLASSYFVGQPIGITRAYHYLGVDPVTGLYQFLDQNGNPTTAPSTVNDRTVLINTDPKWYGGFQNRIHLGSMEIGVFFQFTKQKQSSLAYFYFGRNAPGTASLNQPASILDRWQKTGDEARIQKYSTATAAFTSWSNTSRSDMVIGDASFIRLKSITATYELKGRFLNKLYMEKMRLFAEGQNLLTISKFKGVDPENQSSSSLPPLKVLVIGLNIQF